MRSLLIVYVDDLLLVSPKKHTAAIWTAIEAGIRFKDPAAPLARYLGVHHDISIVGTTTTLAVNMKEFLQSAVAKYCDEVGPTKLPAVASPYLDADTPMTPEDALPGRQAATCASHLMKLLYAGRMCCPWLVTAITRLASHLTRWSQHHDRALRRAHGICCPSTCI